MSADRGLRIIRPRRILFLALAAAAIVSAVATAPPFDFWWHLAAGRWIAEHGSVPRVEPFSWAADRPDWIAYSWLYEWLSYRLYRRIGEPSQVLFSGAMILAILGSLAAWLADLRAGRREPAMLVLAIWSLYNVLTSRTWLISILFLILTLQLIPRVRRGRGWVLPAMFALWANLHVQFVIGLGVLGLAALAERDRAARGRLLRVTAASLVAACLNPYGARIFGVVAEYARTSTVGLPVQEVLPMSFRYEGAWAAAGLAAWTIVEVARAVRAGRRPPIFETAFFVIGIAFALHMVRDIWIGALASLALLGAMGEALPVTAVRAGEAGDGDTRFRRGILATALVALILVAGVFRWREKARADRVEATLPVAASRFLAASSLPGPLFNSFEWGTYVIWALPQYPVSIDGRTTQYSREKILADFSTWEGAPSWRDNRDLAASRLVLANRLNGLTQILDSSPEFERVYQDDHAEVFKRR